MSDIFISYASNDRLKAASLADKLKGYGWSVWWDRTIPPGRTFDDVIEEALSEAKCVIVLWSDASVSSKWVRAEAGEALNRNILIPALIEDLTPPLAFRQIQAAPLVDWNGEGHHAGLRQLVRAVSSIVGPALQAHVEETTQSAHSGAESATFPAIPVESPKKRQQVHPSASKRGKAIAKPSSTVSRRALALIVGIGVVGLLVTIAAIVPFKGEDPGTEKSVVRTKRAPLKDPTPTPDQEIAKLLAQAESWIRAGRLATPRGDNALDAFRAVLKLEPGNEVARQGVELIYWRYIELAKGAISARLFDKADAYLEQAEAILPREPAVQRVRGELLTAVQAADDRPARAEEPKERIEQLLNEAEESLKTELWTERAANDALEKFRAVQQLDPGNPQAKQGIDRIVARLVEVATVATDSTLFEEADAYLSQAETLRPKVPSVRSARVQLTARREAHGRGEQIAHLLAAGKGNLDANRMTWPPGDNALEQFRAVLRLDSGNAEANAGLEQIVERYVQLAMTAGTSGHFDEAQRYLDRAETIRPRATSVQTAREQLQAMTATRAAETKRVQQIRRLLAEAEKSLQAGRLTRPPGDNALEQFRAAQALDRENAEAKAGFERIVERYVQLAVNAATSGHFDEAHRYVDRAETVQPGAASLATARARLRTIEAKNAGAKIAAVEKAKPRATPVAKESASKTAETRPRKEVIARAREDPTPALAAFERREQGEGPRDQPGARQVAIFPFKTSASCYSSPAGRLYTAARGFIDTEPSLTLGYSYHAGSRARQVFDEGGKESRVWAGNYVRGEPDVSRVQKMGERLKADAVLMAWIECSDNERIKDDQYPFEVYVFDLVSQKTFQHKDKLTNVGEGTRKVLEDFVANRGGISTR
jgi:tetratricopeptide (TPR) repeat protein